MPLLLAAQNSNLAYCPSYVPVVVVFGGTSGIGEGIVRLLASNTKGRAHIIIVGRNRAAAETIIASLPKPSEADVADSQYEFVACDVTVMKNVHDLADDLKARLPKINYLVLSAGVFGLGGRVETVDGLDSKLASRFYSRFAAIQDLLPLLKEAKARGEDAAALSILGAGQSSKLNFDDLGLKMNYSGLSAMMQSVCYNDLMVQGFAEREPDIAFIHTFPGFVDTPALTPKFDNWVLDWIAVATMFVLRPLVWAFATTPKDCAEYMTYALLNTDRGMARRGEKGDELGIKSFPPATEEQKRLFWEHSVDAVSGERSTASTIPID